MKDKILFWLTDELLYFCIANSLQKKYDAEFYGIVEENNPGSRIFFRKQKFVKFEELWYLRDYSTIKNLEPDFEYLKEIEKKYQINLWQTAYTERLFYEEFNVFHKFTRDEILIIIEQLCRLFEHVLDKVNPKFLLINLITRLPGYLLYQICLSRNIQALILESSNFANKVFISKKINAVLDPEKHVYHEVRTQRSPKELMDFIQKYKQITGTLYDFNYKIPKFEKYWAAIKFFLSPTQKDDFYRNYGYSKRKTLRKKSNVLLSLQKKKRELFMNKNLLQGLPSGESFVYFPLHKEPERTTLMFAPFYTNQITVIENIAKSLPIDHMLYVKDHPVVELTGWRDIKFYKKIMRLPNVRLLHPSIKSIEIIKHASLIISIAGSSTIEAAFYNKPSIIFADLDFAVLPFVYRLKSLEDLPNAIRKMLKQKVDFSHLNQYVDYVENQSITFDRAKYLSDFNSTFYYKGFHHQVEIPISKMRSFLENNINVFDKLVEEFVKKLKPKNHNIH